MSDDLDGFDSENEKDDEVHSNLISSVTQLEGKHRVKASVRNEPSVEVSEFHLVKSGTGKRDAVHLRELAAVLGNRSSHVDITQKIRATIRREAKTLPKPLEKVEAKRIVRTVQYQNAQEELSKWDAVVKANRALSTISFPLNHEPINFEKSNEFVKKFKAETDLEMEMEKALNGGVVTEEVTVMEKSDFPLTLAEMVSRRRELARLRAQQSYREQKASRQNKIKSKKYHRILRKEKIKQQLKDFEVLKNTNPELALQQLEELDKSCAQERASLRHRSTGRWAKGKAIRAKYDTESRKVLAQQLAISKDLTQKVHKDESSDDNDDVDVPVKAINGSNNPWVDPWASGPVTAGQEVSQFFNSYQMYKEKQTNIKAAADNKQEPTLSDGGVVPDKVVAAEVEAAEVMKAQAEVATAKPIPLPGKKNSSKQASNAENQLSGRTLKDGSPQGSDSQPENRTKVKTKANTLPDLKTGGKKAKNAEKQVKGRKLKDSTQPGSDSQAENRTKVKAKANTLPDLETGGKKAKNAEKQVRGQTLKDGSLQRMDSQPGNKTKVKTKPNPSPDLKTDSQKVKGKATKASGKNAKTSPVRSGKAEVGTAAGKNKRKRKAEIVPAASGGWIVDVEEQEAAPAGKRPKKRRADDNIDALFDNIDVHFKKKLSTKMSRLKSKLQIEDGNFMATDKDGDDHYDDGGSLALKTQSLRPAADMALDEGPTAAPSAPTARPPRPANVVDNGARATRMQAGADIDPTKFMTVTPKHLNTKLPDVMVAGEEAIDDELQRQMTITEAFADDDVVADFRKEQEEVEKSRRPEPKPLSMPGWGHWDSEPKSKFAKRNKKTGKKPEFVAKRPLLIINDTLNPKLVEHMLCSLPAPFKSVRALETSLRAPLGSTWLTETAHRKMTAPSVITKLGTIIKPMDENSLLKTMELPESRK